MITNRVTAVSLFSGCGGFDLGASRAGVNIVFANDNDLATLGAYKSILPDVDFKLSNIEDIKSFPQADILIGCYPCTGFSLAARRKWKTEPVRNLREVKGNFLYKEYIRALIYIKPKFFFVENVSGMKSAESGWFFDQQLKGFTEAGYSVVFKSLNAVDFGLSQERKRIFIVGTRNDIRKKFVYRFPSPTIGEGKERIKTLEDAIGDMPLWPDGEYDDSKFHGHYLTRNRKRGWNEPSFTIVANAAHIPLHPMGKPMKKIGKDHWVLEGNENRRLSWRECARLQGFPDSFAPSGSLSSKYRVIGNAVPPLFGELLLKQIVDFF
jgi:DNA (cytosine-5)-methyltransferase 1